MLEANLYSVGYERKRESTPLNGLWSSVPAASHPPIGLSSFPCSVLCGESLFFLGENFGLNLLHHDAFMNFFMDTSVKKSYPVHRRCKAEFRDCFVKIVLKSEQHIPSLHPEAISPVTSTVKVVH
jgi:hypothetical protein